MTSVSEPRVCAKAGTGERDMGGWVEIHARALRKDREHWHPMPDRGSALVCVAARCREYD